MKHPTVDIELDGKIIPIDKYCVDLVLFFNKIGLKTRHSCQGDNTVYHDFNIIFEKSVTDEDIKNFLAPYLNKFNHSDLMGKFVKWGRYIGGKYCENWMYVAYDYGFATIDYKLFISKI